jgi:hypothetical protein
MAVRSYRTNLRCAACVESIRPLFDADPGVVQWDADVASPDKRLTVDGDISREAVNALLEQKGYRILDEGIVVSIDSAPAPVTGLKRYWPLLLILIYLLIVTALVEWRNPQYDTDRAMAHFMGGFFLVFSFFKLLDLRAFAQSYARYDLLAQRWFDWGYIYPFCELLLGIAYITRVSMTLTNVLTLVLMLLGAAGVIRSLFRKQQIQCACLGTVFNLPMSWITLLEDLLMAGMAIWMLIT